MPSRQTIFILSFVAIGFITLTWISLGNTPFYDDFVTSTPAAAASLDSLFLLNPRGLSKENVLEELSQELEYHENEHPEPWIPTEMPQSIVNKSCPRYIMQDIESGPGLGHVTGQWTTTLVLALWYNLTLVHSPIANPNYQNTNTKGVHGTYEDLDGFLGMGYGEIQKKDFDFNSVKIINLRGGGAPRSTDEAANFQVFTEDIVRDHGKECNVLFKQPQFFQYDYSGHSKWIQVRKWMATRKLNPIKTEYDYNFINIAVHVRTGDIEPNRGTPEIFFYRLLNEYILPVIDDLPFRIYIFSEGLDPNKFPRLTTLPNVIERTQKDMSAFETYHHLIEGDIMIMSRSGFSQFAAIFSHRPLVFSPPSRESFPLRFPPIGSIAATLDGRIESQEVMRIRRFRERWIRSQQIKEQIKLLKSATTSIQPTKSEPIDSEDK